MLLVQLPAAVFSQDDSDALRPFTGIEGMGARALGMGGAYTAVSDDYSASFWNPAGLAQLRKIEIYGSISHFDFNNDVVFFNETTSSGRRFTKLDAIGFVYPFPVYRGSLVFSAGRNTLRRFDEIFSLSAFNTILKLDQREKIRELGGMVSWNFAGAVDITKNFSLGATFNFYDGINEYSSNYIEKDVSDHYTFDEYRRDFVLTPSYSGIGLKLGGLYRLGKIVRMGATISSPTYLTAEESYKVYEFEKKDDGSSWDNQYKDQISYGLKFPYTFQLGFSTFIKSALLAGDVEYLDWSQIEFESDIVDSLGNSIDPAVNDSVRTKYRQTLSYRFGAEISLPMIKSKVRGGYQFIPAPQSGLDGKNDRKVVSAGYSFLMDKQVKIDLAYQYGWWERITFEELVSADSVERIKVNRFLFSIVFRF